MKNENNSITINVEEDGHSIKQVIKSKLGFSSRLCSKIKKNNSAYINDKQEKLSKLTYAGDKITICLDDDKADEYDPVKMDLEILYEDDYLLVVNKPAFMVVHPSKSHFTDSLANGIRYYFDKHNIKNKIRLVNRLDMNTTGIVIIAKNSFTHFELAKQMTAGTVDKYYMTIVEGVTKESGTITDPIARLNEKDIKRVVHESGKKCITKYKRMKVLTYLNSDKFSLLMVKLETGRTHQIRVHMTYHSHPLLGDDLYNEESRLIKRQALHCFKMSFDHPLTKKRITVEAEMPEDFQKVIDMCKSE